MTVQVTATRKNTQALEIQESIIGRRNDAPVKVDQVGIVGAVSLSITNAVRIMTGIARCSDIADMLLMGPERFIIQNACPAVTSVAKFIGRSRFHGIICRLILVFKLCSIDGAMGPGWCA